MTEVTSSAPTKSARALHLYCCMQTSLYIAFDDKERKWSEKHRMAHCVGENLQPLDPSDHGLQLLAKLSFKLKFNSNKSMSDIRREVTSIFAEDINERFLKQRETLYHLLSLRAKPGGWAQLDVLWEHFTGTSLTHVVSHIPMSNYLNPCENYENGSIYKVDPTWYQWSGEWYEDGQPSYYLNPLPQHFVGNDLLGVISSLDDHARRCYETIGNEDLAEKLVLNVTDSAGNSIFSLELPDAKGARDLDVELLLDNLHIHSNQSQVLSTIKKAFGENAYLRFIGKKFGQDLSL